MVSDEPRDHVSGLYRFREVREFKADIEFFLSRYAPVTLQDVIRHLDGERGLPKRCFLPTFDDGFREMHEVVAPILKAQGVPAVFFLITSALDNQVLCYPQKKSLLLRAFESLPGSAMKQKATEILTHAGIQGPDLPACIRSVHYRKRAVLDVLGALLDRDFESYSTSARPYLSSAQVSDLLKMGFAIGAHSVDHPLYSELALEDQLAQTRESLQRLSERFAYQCLAFAFPYRDTGVSRHFFDRAFSEGQLAVSFGTGGLARHFFERNLPRFSMERTDLPAELILARHFGRTLLNGRQKE